MFVNDDSKKSVDSYIALEFTNPPAKDKFLVVENVEYIKLRITKGISQKKEMLIL